MSGDEWPHRDARSKDPWRDGVDLYVPPHASGAAAPPLPAVVILQGAGVSRSEYSRLACALRDAGHVVVVPDLVPRGRTYLCPDGSSLEALLTGPAPRSVIDAVDRSGILLVGHSAGGIAALETLELWARNLGRLCGIVTFGSTAPGAIRSGGFAPPILLVTGDRDTVVPTCESAAAFCRLGLPLGTLLELRGADHYSITTTGKPDGAPVEESAPGPFAQWPELFARLVAEFARTPVPMLHEWLDDFCDSVPDRVIRYTSSWGGLTGRIFENSRNASRAAELFLESVERRAAELPGGHPPSMPRAPDRSAISVNLAGRLLERPEVAASILHELIGRTIHLLLRGEVPRARPVALAAHDLAMNRAEWDPPWGDRCLEVATLLELLDLVAHAERLHSTALARRAPGQPMSEQVLAAAERLLDAPRVVSTPVNREVALRRLVDLCAAFPAVSPGRTRALRLRLAGHLLAHGQTARAVRELLLVESLGRDAAGTEPPARAWIESLDGPAGDDGGDRSSGCRGRPAE